MDRSVGKGKAWLGNRRNMTIFVDALLHHKTNKEWNRTINTVSTKQSQSESCSGMLGAVSRGDNFMPEKMAPPKYRVRLICASKHVYPGSEANRNRGL